MTLKQCISGILQFILPFIASINMALLAVSLAIATNWCSVSAQNSKFCHALINTNKDVVYIFRCSVCLRTFFSPCFRYSATDVVQQYGVYEFTTLDTLRRWNDAETACEAWGGHLASSGDSGENRFISDLVLSGQYVSASASQG